MAQISGKQFLGKWRGDGSCYTNYDAFAKASGMPDDLIEKFKNAESEVDFKCENGQWCYDFKSTAGDAKKYDFVPGKEMETTDSFGKGVKFTITFVSETEMAEITKSEMMGWNSVSVKREIKENGNKMLETISLEDGTTMTFLMTKC